jgi:hypothetical protein
MWVFLTPTPTRGARARRATSAAAATGTHGNEHVHNAAKSILRSRRRSGTAPAAKAAAAVKRRSCSCSGACHSVARDGPRTLLCNGGGPESVRVALQSRPWTARRAGDVAAADAPAMCRAPIRCWPARAPAPGRRTRASDGAVAERETSRQRVRDATGGAANQRPAGTSPPRAHGVIESSKVRERRRAVRTVTHQGCRAARRAHARRLRWSGGARAEARRLKLTAPTRAPFVLADARKAAAASEDAAYRSSACAAPDQWGAQREQPAGVAAARAAEAPVETAARCPVDSAVASARLAGCTQLCKRSRGRGSPACPLHTRAGPLPGAAGYCAACP